jgi:hypothetical protein
MQSVGYSSTTYKSVGYFSTKYAFSRDIPVQNIQSVKGYSTVYVVSRDTPVQSIQSAVMFLRTNDYTYDF